MPEDKNENPEIEHFEVDTVFDNRVHERYSFTLKIEGDEYKGHFHEDEIQWLHPHPKQMLGEEQMEAIESKIHLLMRKYGIATDSGIEDLEITSAFEDTAHERKQFTLKVHGEEYKAFMTEGEIQWFHPHPKQKLEDEHVEAIESEIYEEVAKKEIQEEQ
ncbi:hypothetical protein D4T97_011965 [Siminovitchia acidinfaciens]|uniref:HicA family toxin-antitoxin system n=1 Tax=Siminovitchia acidinfaciens TaxID=2321395 RepID=A0A429Y010_9BACI|nr:hypothetical protein [Siminovitchia acidinfaciens]RST74375.1 hypothetical protein D4T97_011965 [Siminovitchia acidinfaciens]